MNSSSTKPNKQQQSTAQKSNDIGQTLGEKLKPISIASTPSSYENTNLSQSLYNPGFNNENILSQLITNSSNTNGNGNPNYFTMRRERSLDRAPVTENFVENYLINPGTNSLRRSYTNNASQSPQNVAAMFNGKTFYKSIRNLEMSHLKSWYNMIKIKVKIKITPCRLKYVNQNIYKL